MFCPRPILIVDDDAALRSTLAEHISQHTGFDADQTGSAAEAEARLAITGAPHAAILLDADLPDGGGRALCARLRRRGLTIPIVLLAEANAEQDVVCGLDAGANDYVSKPFRADELLARVRAQLRAFDASEDATFAVGSYLFRPALKLLRDPASGRRVHLTAQESRLLWVLCLAEGRMVARQVLLDAVWGTGSGASTTVLSRCIYNLRQKIEPELSSLRLLLTESDGYRLDLGAGLGRCYYALKDANDQRTFGEAFRSEGGI